MSREAKLSELDEVLDDLDYPATVDDVQRECGDVTLVLADGTENLGDLVADSSDDQFDSRDDLANEVMNLLPRHAVGEPYQSEGEG